MRVKRVFKQRGYVSGAMQRSTLFLAQAALALASGVVGLAAAVAAEDGAPLRERPVDREKAPLVSIPEHSLKRIGDGGAEILPVFRDRFRLPGAQQVRIEQRVTIRISPRPAPMPLAAMGAEETRDLRAPRIAERRMGKCVPLGSVLGVQSGGGNKLVLFLRGQRLVSATLDRGQGVTAVAESYGSWSGSHGQILMNMLTPR